MGLTSDPGLNSLSSRLDIIDSPRRALPRVLNAELRVKLAFRLGYMYERY